MRRANNLLPRIADPDNLRLAAWKAAKGKRHSAEVLAWSTNLDVHLEVLREEIMSGQIRVGSYRYFKVYEPKERQICASAFGEQVLHHALMNVCHPFFDRLQIYDSYASRKDKGTYAALERAKFYTKRHDWFLKLDVRKFFESIAHEVLVEQLCAMFKEHQIVGVFEQIIRSYEASPGRGLPIGNLTSQYFANHYLSGLDRLAKENLQCRAYVRYMDDFVFWNSNKLVLLQTRDLVTDFVKTQLRCSLKPEVLNRTQRGLPFLGYRVFPYHVRLLQKSKKRLFKKVELINEHYHTGLWCEGKCQRRLMPLLAFAQHAQTDTLRKNLILRLNGQSP